MKKKTHDVCVLHSKCDNITTIYTARRIIHLLLYVYIITTSCVPTKTKQEYNNFIITREHENEKKKYIKTLLYSKEVLSPSIRLEPSRARKVYMDVR